jgi:hypothetical protein
LPVNKDRPYLKHIYDNIKVGERPTYETIINLFIQCAQFLKVRVLFDALDEFRESESGKIYHLIERFRNAHIGVYITTRPHIVGHLRLSDATVMQNIQATEGDIHRLLENRIREHREHVGEDVKAEIIKKIGKAQGM